MRVFVQHHWLGMVAAAILCAVPLVLIAPSVRSQPAQQAAAGNVLAAVKIIWFSGSVARFDTATGEVSRFSGDLRPLTANGTWIRVVPPVPAQSTSGFLTIREIEGATFLVDRVNGDTW